MMVRGLMVREVRTEVRRSPGNMPRTSSGPEGKPRKSGAVENPGQKSGVSPHKARTAGVSFVSGCRTGEVREDQSNSWDGLRDAPDAEIVTPAAGDVVPSGVALLPRLGGVADAIRFIPMGSKAGTHRHVGEWVNRMPPCALAANGRRWDVGFEGARVCPICGKTFWRRGTPTAELHVEGRGWVRTSDDGGAA